MRGLDILAAACAPQEQTNATPAGFQALTDEQCDMIASKVLEKLQGSQQKTDPEPENVEPETEPEEGGDNGESELS